VRVDDAKAREAHEILLVRYPAAGAARPRHGLHEGQKQSPGSWGFSNGNWLKIRHVSLKFGQWFLTL